MEPVVPKDLLLPLPAPSWLLVGLLLLSFALHILFVNLMVGGSVLVLFTEILGRRKRDWDRVSRAIGETITVNKSIAVVLGVGPLLTLSVLYTMQFYTANALTGHVWLLVIPLVILAFLLTYAHKYSWDKLEKSKGLHIAMSAAATAIFLSIPFIFLTEINLMLYPERWREIGSFWDALLLPNVFPRYLHFLAATIALVGLFCAWYLGREKRFRELHLETVTRQEIIQTFLGVTLGATALQLLFGPLLLLTLPAHVISSSLILVLLAVATLAVIVVLWLWREVTAPVAGARFNSIVILLTVVVSLMVWGRHDIRETAIIPHRALIAQKTADYAAKVQAARNYLVMPGGLGGETLSPGARLFGQRCASCHAFDKRLVGPPLNEAAKLYKGNPQGIVKWALNPGRRRSDYPAMPAQQVPAADLLQIANYILDTAGQQ